MSRPHDIIYSDLPTLLEEPVDYNWHNGCTMLRQAVAKRLKLNGSGAISIAESLNIAQDAGFQTLGRGELLGLRKQCQDEKTIPRRIRYLWLRKPYNQPFILFPRDDIENEYIPALTPLLKSWQVVAVKQTLVLCSNRFIIPIKHPVT